MLETTPAENDREHPSNSNVDLYIYESKQVLKQQSDICKNWSAIFKTAKFENTWARGLQTILTWKFQPKKSIDGKMVWRKSAMMHCLLSESAIKTLSPT